MAKLKTHKATAKRVIVKKHKLLKRKSGQDHFNARESSKTRLNKRRDMEFDPTLAKTARRQMPYA
ncbi:MAG: 50S ribosomal protein L35 [bacterium]|nr:50S ribosomal protein L35 [bacterium]